MPASFRIALVPGLIALTAARQLASANPVETAWVTEVRVGPAAHGSPVVTGSLGPRTAKSHALDGIASYYWQGQMTASGEVFDKRAMTAAHPTLPFGTLVAVTNLRNGKSTVVRINDRGPFKPGRIIDVSEAAAEILDMQSRGLAPVKLEVVSAASGR
jgi:rare lipoprotein A (peptidoglycan hydrolase)